MVLFQNSRQSPLNGQNDHCVLKEAIKRHEEQHARSLNFQLHSVYLQDSEMLSLRSVDTSQREWNLYLLVVLLNWRNFEALVAPGYHCGGFVSLLAMVRAMWGIQVWGTQIGAHCLPGKFIVVCWSTGDNRSDLGPHLHGIRFPHSVNAVCSSLGCNDRALGKYLGALYEGI